MTIQFEIEQRAGETGVPKPLEELLQAEGIHLDDLYVCPRIPEDDCSCRKPKLGLLQKAADDLGFRLENSIVIEGQRHRDGPQAVAMRFPVRTGCGAQFENEVAGDYVVDDLAAAVRVLENMSSTRHR